MRITAITFDRGANAQYRVFYPLQALAKRGHAVRAATIHEVKNPRDLLDTDVLLFWRVFGNMAEWVAGMLRQNGVGLVWDNDDDTGAIPKGEPAYRIFGGLQGRQNVKSMLAVMRRAHVVTTPSARLAERYREAGGTDVRVIENFPRSTPGTLGRLRSPGQVTIGWVAGLEHRMDVQRLGLEEPLQRLLDRHPNVSIVTIGCRLELKGTRYRHIKSVPLNELVRHIAQFDVGIAPIADIPFNRARSNVKLKEYAVAGVPWLASPIGPYATLGEEQGGRLAEDGRWYDELSVIVTDTALRQRLTSNAARWGRDETIGKNVHRWETALADACQRARSAAVS